MFYSLSRGAYSPSRPLYSLSFGTYSLSPILFHKNTPEHSEWGLICSFSLRSCWCEEFLWFIPTRDCFIPFHTSLIPIQPRYIPIRPIYSFNCLLQPQVGHVNNTTFYILFDKFCCLLI